VPVLITSCQVSEKPNNGPVTAHTTMEPKASANTHARPTAREVAWASSENRRLIGSTMLLGPMAFAGATPAPFLFAPFAMAVVVPAMFAPRQCCARRKVPFGPAAEGTAHKCSGTMGN